MVLGPVLTAIPLWRRTARYISDRKLTGNIVSRLDSALVIARKPTSEETETVRPGDRAENRQRGKSQQQRVQMYDAAQS